MKKTKENNVDHTENTPSVLSFCTGYGGIEIGIARALGKINVLAHVEIEAYAVANLVAKMETGQMVPAPVWTNLKTFRPSVFRNRVDILTGGYPCQPFSAAGKRKGNKDPRHLWPWIRSTIKVIRPGVCFFENVEGHISLGLREVLTDLAKLGYRVENDSGEPTWGLFSAAECGAPHQRKRVFILAYRNSAEWRPQSCQTNELNGDDGGRKKTAGWLRKLCPQLGNPQGHNQRWAPVPAMHRERVTPGGSGGDVADAGSPEFNRVSKPEERRKDRAVGQPGVELADDTGQGLERGCGLEGPDQGRSTTERIGHDIARCGCFPQRWPARPGEPQHPWEESRVVADTSHQLQHRRGNPWAPGRGEPTDQSYGQVESGMGGAIDGNTHRVDRLRLLGNGVVPATAERAFTVLMNRVLHPHRERPPIEIQMEMFA